MTDVDNLSVSGISESVQFERELIEESYPAENFIPDLSDQHKYSLLLFPQVQPFFVSARISFNTSPPYPLSQLVCRISSNKDRLEPGNSVGLTEHQVKELQASVDRCCLDALKIPDIAADKVIGVVKEFLNDNNTKHESLHESMEKNLKAVNVKIEEPLIVHRLNGKFEKKFPPCISPGDQKQLFKDPISPANSFSYNLTCLSERSDLGIYNSFDNTNHKLHLIHEFILDLSAVKIQSELENIKKEFARTIKLNPHASVVRYLALGCRTGPNISNVVHVLTGEALPLSNFTLPYCNGQLLTKEVISGLQFLHHQDLLHGYLTIDSVFVTKQGRHQIGDYGFAKKLLVNSHRAPFKKFSLKFSDATCDEAGRWLDVLLLGHLVYHVSVGRQPDSAYPTLPGSLDPILREFIKSCVAQDKHFRASLQTLATHDFIGETILHISDNTTEQEVNFSTEGTGTLDNFTEGGDEVWSKSNRLKNEYDVKGVLGKGGFGSVIKVRNKIDGSFYAMKVVKIPRSSKNAIEQMRKEVKLLSQLKHNNIVRYNSVYIESQVAEQSPDNSTTDQNRSNLEDSSSEESWALGTCDSFESEFDNEISFKPSMAEIRSRYHEDISTDTTDSSHVAQEHNAVPDDESDDGIVFAYSRKPSVEGSVVQSEMNNPFISPLQNSMIVMFIQMEFCENTTLRTLIESTSIDPPIHKDMDLLLKLFRQIVDALEYIHFMKIIHRDLKPENIFLDARNDVKIGDFGLAVRGSQGKGVVGTSSYIAPEVKSHRKYSPLVDIYSLGVICFEMAAGPFKTKSERCIVLQDLRSPDVFIPGDVFVDDRGRDLEVLIRQMLQHEPKERPKAAELGKSDILPPRLAQQGIQEILRHINSEHGSQRRDQFMDSLFSNDIVKGTLNLTCYDQFDAPDTQKQTASFTRTMNDIIERMTPVFLKHGGVQCPLPFVLPKCDLTDGQKRPFIFLSKSGHYQVLPSNLKLNLAKHVFQNKIKDLKRYGFTQVFRKRPDKNRKPDPNPNPRDILEGSFDVISSTNPVIAKAEVLLTVLDVIKAIPEFKHQHITIYVNHTKIMKAILLFYKIDRIHHGEILKAMFEYSGNYTKLKDKLKQECDFLNERQISSFLTLLKFEGPVDKIHKHVDNKDTNFKAIFCKSGSRIGNLFKEGLREILQVLLIVSSHNHLDSERILDPKRGIAELADQLSETPSYASDIGKLVKIRTGICNDPLCFSELMFQVVIQRPDIDSKLAELIAVGGDFQMLLEQWRDIATESAESTDPLPSAFGVNFLLEDMSSILTSPCIKAKVLIISNRKDAKYPLIFSLLKALWEHSIRAEHGFSDERPLCGACHKVTFELDSITIESDAGYMKSIGLREDKGYDTKSDSGKLHQVSKFKVLKYEEVLKYLIDVELHAEQQEVARKHKTLETQRSGGDVGRVTIVNCKRYRTDSFQK